MTHDLLFVKHEYIFPIEYNIRRYNIYPKSPTCLVCWITAPHPNVNKIEIYLIKLDHFNQV
jgi:hypothetical protein